jgi:deoxyribonuclease V
MLSNFSIITQLPAAVCAIFCPARRAVNRDGIGRNRQRGGEKARPDRHAALRPGSNRRMSWPSTLRALEAVQREIATRRPEAWELRGGDLAIGGCFVCFPAGATGPGAAGQPAWAAAAVMTGSRPEAESVVEGVAGAAYEPGLLALREGALLEAAVRALSRTPDVLLVDATGRDHPRRCGLALHLGAVLDVPTVGVTHRPLVAEGDWPPDEAGASTPLALAGEVVGYWLRSRAGTRPLAVHAGWRTSHDVALEVVRRSLITTRTPEPLRRARELARLARHEASP